MLRNRRNRLVLWILGLCLVLFVGCNSFASETRNEKWLYSADKIEETSASKETSATQTEEKKPIVITQEQFAKLVADYRKEWKFLGKKPCVVDFYADWCRPCRMMEPAFAKMAEKYEGKVNFYKINVDYNKEISNAYQIAGIPTLFFCSAEGKLTRISGLLTEEQIAAYIETILAKK